GGRQVANRGRIRTGRGRIHAALGGERAGAHVAIDGGVGEGRRAEPESRRAGGREQRNSELRSHTYSPGVKDAWEQRFDTGVPRGKFVSLEGSAAEAPRPVRGSSPGHDCASISVGWR